MVHQNNLDELMAAWRALGSAASSDGLLTIPILSSPPIKVLAGRIYPNNYEAVLFEFVDVDAKQSDMPKGKGFEVSVVNSVDDSQGYVALVRDQIGNLDLFTAMSVDVVKSVVDYPAVNHKERYENFLSRVRAWQEFMSSRPSGMLTGEEEIGLIGELLVLEKLLILGIRPSELLMSWKGPDRGIHDFVFSDLCDFEIKSSVSTDAFVAKIVSLEQLMPPQYGPLYFLGCQLALIDNGFTLPDLISRVRDRLNGSLSALSMLNFKLIKVGYLDSKSEGYKRRFAEQDLRVHEVRGLFPRLTHVNAPTGVIQATYEIAIDGIDLPNLTFDELTTTLRV